MTTIRAGDSLRFSQDSVYFAFGSGRLRYDCVACNAQCCRGHGYTLAGAGETSAHLAESAAVRFFVNRCDAESNHLHVTNCAPACFFLDKAGLCRIQTKGGYSAKPETCRLFPFNEFLRVGSFLVVLPHPGLCPLEIILEKESNSDCSEHGNLLEAMALSGIDTHVASVGLDIDDAAGAIAAERRIVALSDDYLMADDYLAFAAAQMHIHSGGVSDSSVATTDLQCFVGIHSSLLWPRIAALFGFRMRVSRPEPIQRESWLQLERWI